MIEQKAIWKLISRHKSRAEDERREWDQYDSWLRSEYWDVERSGAAMISPTVSGFVGTDDDDLANQTNYAYAFIDTMIANICPTNPQITIDARSEEWADVAKANEALVNDTIRRNKLHDLLWSTAMQTSVCGRGIMRTVWNEKKKMPCTYPVEPRAFFYDMSVPWTDARYMCEAVPITEAEWNLRLKRGSKYGYNKEAVEKVNPSGYPKWLTRHKANTKFDGDDASKSHFNWVVIYEFYDLGGGMYYHFAEDVDEPLLAIPLKKVFRYMSHPYTLVVFNQNLRENSGVSDIKLISSAQRRLNELDSLELQHIHTALPVTFVNESLIDDPADFKAQINGGLGPNDIVTLKVRDNAPLSAVIFSSQPTNLSNAHGDKREQLKQQIEFTLGIPAYSRGKTGVAEVATELALADTATRTRNGRRIKIMGDAVVDVAKKMGALWQEHIGERKFPVRSRADELKTTLVDAAALGYGDGEEDEIILWEDSWWFDFEAVPFSPTENHRLVQLNKLQTFLGPLMQMPFTNQQRFVKKLLDLLGMGDIYDESAQPAQAAPPGGAPPGAGPAGPETLGSGAMPEGADVEDLNAVDARAMAQQPLGGS